MKMKNSPNVKFTIVIRSKVLKGKRKRDGKQTVNTRLIVRSLGHLNCL